MKKTLTYLLLGVILFSVSQTAFARDETVGKVYHFVFKLAKDISAQDNAAIISGLKAKMDTLGIITYNIQRDKDMFIISVKTHWSPDTIVSAILAEKNTLPLTPVTYFLCDFGKEKEGFTSGGY